MDTTFSSMTENTGSYEKDSWYWVRRANENGIGFATPIRICSDDISRWLIDNPDFRLLSCTVSRHP